MTKASLKKSWIILTSFSLVSTAIVLACADSGPEYGTSNFTPETFVDQAYSPFFYSNQFYYGIGHDEAHITRWNERNTHEWAAWLDRKGREADVSFLLDTADADAINSTAAYLDGRRPALPSALLAYRLLADRHDKKLAAFLHYLVLAKKCEAFSLAPITYWDRDTTKKVRFNAGPLDKQLQQGLTASTDNFLQERYWFQLVRSHFFNGTPQETIRTFHDYSPKFTSNKLWYRSLAYMAGACYKQKDYSRANYYYSRVFDSCDELKTVAHYSFHPQEEADWTATLALCRNNEEKATLWQMLGIFYTDPQRAIRQIYSLDPKSTKLDVLLSRAVNASEQRFSAGTQQYPDLPIAPGDHSNDSLRSLVTRIAEAENTATPWIWQLAAGYLCMLDKQYSTAASFFRKAAPLVPNDRLAQAQFRLLKLLNIIAGARVIDHALEQQLLPDIRWMISDQKDPGYRHDDAMVWLRRTMAQKYKAAGDKIKAECFLSQPAFYTDHNNVEALIAFFNKLNKTSYEELCASLSAIQLTDLFEYQAVRLCLDDHPEEALKPMKEAAADTTTLPANPFNARIVDCHDCDHEAPQKIRYTKGSFLQKLKEIKEKITAGADVYTNAILMGNAYYNITHYGNTRAFYECQVLGFGHSTPESIDSVFRAPLTSMSSAVKYYTLALGAAQNSEQRAKCQYLLAKCQRNEWYNATFRATYDYNGPAFIAFDGFQALKQYAGTNYYKEVLHECGYFRTYTQKHP